LIFEAFFDVFDNLNALDPILVHKIEWSFVLLHWKHTHTTIHNVSNRRNSPPCRILRSRYGERNVPNEPRRLNFNKNSRRKSGPGIRMKKIMGNIPLFFIQSLAMGGNRHSFVTHFFLSLISFCHSFLFVTHFFLSLIS